MAFLVAVSLIVVACATAAPAATPSPIGAATKQATAVPTVHGDTLSIDASIGYSGFREWVTIWAGIALVEITDVGPVRWNTVSGVRPDESLLHSAPKGHADTPGIGRIVEVRRIRLISGQWLGGEDLARYWKVGGKIAADEMIDSLNLPTFRSGDRALAFLLPQVGNVAVDGDLPVQVGWLFPVDASGRVQTLDPTEDVTLANLDALLS